LEIIIKVKLFIYGKLPPSPVIGDNHKGETLYLWETSSGEVWETFGDKETHLVYRVM